IDSAEVIAEGDGFLALVATVTIAVWTRKSNEMVGYYLTEALSRATNANLGARIRREIKNVLIFDGYSFDDADATLQQWLDEEEAAGSLTHYLSSVSPAALGGNVLYLFNAARQTSTL